MTEYLGEVPVTDMVKTPTEWAMLWIMKYGGIDGEHHKTWVIDQVARILQGTPVIVKRASWSDGQSEYRYTLGETTKEYDDFVKECLGDWDEDGETYEYEYDTGCAP